MYSLSARMTMPFTLRSEVEKHFNPQIFEQSRLQEMSGTLAEISRLAQRKFRGNPFIDMFHSRDGNITAVSISIAQPGIQLPVSRYLFEGDILLTPDQANEILTNLLRVLRSKRDLTLHSRVRRKLLRTGEAKWRRFPISYSYHPTLSQSTAEKVHHAVTYWQDHTCIQFRDETGRARGDYIEFFRGLGCYSMIGRIGGRQGISIGNGCDRAGIIAHEIGHALGMWHEQSRPDAINHIYLAPRNIIPAMLSNFLQRSWAEVETFGIPYDLGSVMHYGPTAFTNDWTKKTIFTHIPAYQRTIGQREKPSFYDVKAINNAYCGGRCPRSLPCQNSGYTHPGNCNRCICPEGLGGRFCNQNEPSRNAQCGGVINLQRGKPITITSPGFPRPGYDQDQKCSWLVQAPIGKQVSLQFVEEYQFFCTTTCMDYAEVKNSTDMGLTGMRFCCYDKPIYTIFSDRNKLVVIFRSLISRDVGFKAIVGIYPDEDPLPTSIPTPPTTLGPPTTKRKEVKLRLTSQPEYTTTMSPLEGQWASWSSWSSCSKSCGACGLMSRLRRCMKPPCKGDAKQFKRCAFNICPGETACTQVKFQDEPCGHQGANVCSRAVEVTFECKFPSCCPPFKPIQEECRLKKWSDAESWDHWSEWGHCIGPKCGGCAVQARHRVCNEIRCTGPETQFRRCNTAVCADCSRQGDLFPVRCDSSGGRRNVESETCVKHKNDMKNHITCPCCEPLKPKNGQCLP